jgi:uncharacterized protein
MDVNTKDSNGNTALIRAAREGNLEEVSRQLEKKAINAQNHGRSTALHEAAEEGHWAVAQLLLKTGADVSLQTTKGETVLHKAFLAKDKVYVAGLQLLFDKGIDTKSRDKYRTTALHIASRRGQAAALRFPT